jgi:MYXO-CTERM domain-containing protein
MLPILTLLAWLAVGTVAPGSVGAHTCVTPVEVYVDQPATVTVGVAAEGLTPVVGVDITIPPGFELDSFVPSGGWQAERKDDRLELRGSQIAGGACGFVLLKGTATSKGRLYLPMRTYDQDGTVRDLDRTEPFNPLAAMVLEARRPGDDAAGGSPVVSFVVIGAVALAVLAAAFAVVRRRRRAADQRATSDPSRPGDRGTYPRRPSTRP